MRRVRTSGFLSLAVIGCLVATASAAARPAIQAHRGGALVNGKPTYPENTMPAFRQAAKNGFVLEFDVKLTKDRVPVVFHDDTLDRVTPCAGEIAERTLAQLGHCKVDVLGAEETLRQLPRGDPRRTPSPTLARALAFVRKTRSRASIEIKNWPPDSDFDPTPAFAQAVTRGILRSGVPQGRLIIQSFWAPNLDVAKQRLPGAALSFLTLAPVNDSGIDTADASGYDWVSPQWPVSLDYVNRAHARGLRVVPYTIDKAADIRGAAAVGVDALITNDPLRARRALAAG